MERAAGKEGSGPGRYGMNRTLRFIQIVMMALVIVFSLVSAVLVLRGLFNRTVVLAREEKTVVWLHVFLHFFIALGVGCAMVYFFRGASKYAAIHYKAFMLLLMVASFIEILMSVREIRLTGDLIFWGDLCFQVVKAVILLVLGVGLDHGKSDTQILFVILLLSDIALIAMSLGSEMESFTIMGIVARLLTNAILFFTIRAKYLDKAMRGTK